VRRWRLAFAGAIVVVGLLGWAWHAAATDPCMHGEAALYPSPSGHRILARSTFICGSDVGATVVTEEIYDVAGPLKDGNRSVPGDARVLSVAWSRREPRIRWLTDRTAVVDIDPPRSGYWRKPTTDVDLTVRRMPPEAD